MTPADFFNVASGITGAVNSIYNIVTNRRDYDYQRVLQKHMEEREDTAVQRRVEDLKAAGMNPALALGSSANAGPVVSRSSTNDVNMGSFLDNLSAANQIKLQRQQTENAKTEGAILNNQLNKLEFDNSIDMYKTMTMLGYGVNPTFGIRNNGKWFVDLDPEYNIGDPLVTVVGKGMLYPGMKKYQNNWLEQVNKETEYMQQQADYATNSNEYLKRQLNWFAADKLMDYAGTLGGIFMPKMNLKLNK